MVRVPPCFWAKAGGDAAKTRKNGPAAANPVRFRFIPDTSLGFRGLAALPSRLRTPAKPAAAPPLSGPIRLGSRDGCRRDEGYHVLPLRVHCPPCPPHCCRESTCRR